MARMLIALTAGVLFGLGLTISEMINPAKVLAFLDVTGDWDPSLAIVMAGALLIAFPAYRAAMGRARPLLAERFDWPVARDVERRLLAGAMLFGVGWGLVGFCPGPAVASFAFGLAKSFVFVGAMAAGAMVARMLPAERSEPLPASA
ncbi:MAG TPA: DUF6691 family protein [Candidatus Binatia bacterium]|nr:DUF6691 family protein [Candidatus Binatia bacterium]